MEHTSSTVIVTTLDDTRILVTKEKWFPEGHVTSIVSVMGSISFKAAKYLAPILNPLTGKNGFTIKNSEDFINKIRDLEIPPPRKMVSYDVSALFTSIPVDEAIRII